MSTRRTLAGWSPTKDATAYSCALCAEERQRCSHMALATVSRPWCFTAPNAGAGALTTHVRRQGLVWRVALCIAFWYCIPIFPPVLADTPTGLTAAPSPGPSHSAQQEPPSAGPNRARLNSSKAGTASHLAPIVATPTSTPPVGARTISASTDGSPGSPSGDWRPELHSSVANVLAFGADPNGVLPSDTAFAAAMRSGRRTVYIPAGSYLFLSPLAIPLGLFLVGDGGVSGATTLRFRGVSAGLMIGDGLSDSYGIAIRGLQVSGDGGTAVSVRHSWQADLRDISVSGEWKDGFWFEWTWGSNFERLSTAGASIRHSCFVVGAAFNANFSTNWYTGSNYAPFNFLFDMTLGNRSGEASHGNHFAMLTAQGGTVGFYVRAFRDSTFDGLYTENVVHPLVLGERRAGVSATGITILGASLGGPISKQPGYTDRLAVIDIDFANGVTIAGANFTGAHGAASVANVSLPSSTGKGAAAVARVNADGSIHSIAVLAGGAGYQSAPDVHISGNGHGAEATAVLLGGSVASIAVTTKGQGYVPRAIPMAVRFNRASRVTFLSPHFDPGEGKQVPLRYFMGRAEHAWSPSEICVVGDLSSGSSADVTPSIIEGATATGSYQVRYVASDIVPSHDHGGFRIAVYP